MSMLLNQIKFFILLQSPILVVKAQFPLKWFTTHWLFSFLNGISLILTTHFMLKHMDRESSFSNQPLSYKLLIKSPYPLETIQTLAFLFRSWALFHWLRLVIFGLFSFFFGGGGTNSGLGIYGDFLGAFEVGFKDYLTDLFLKDDTRFVCDFLETVTDRLNTSLLEFFLSLLNFTGLYGKFFLDSLDFFKFSSFGIS